MNESSAIVIAGIGAAIVVGLVGILSSLIGYRAANKQLQNQLTDNQYNRRHQIFLSILVKRQQAIEDIWKLLFTMERQGNLSEKELDVYIRGLMWLPSDLRQLCLRVLKQTTAERSVNLVSLRQRLIDSANSIDFGDLPLHNKGELKHERK